MSKPKPKPRRKPVTESGWAIVRTYQGEKNFVVPHWYPLKEWAEANNDDANEVVPVRITEVIPKQRVRK